MVGERIMIITGTSKGIGRYLAEYYVSKGFIVIGCSRSEPTIDSPLYKHYTLDVSDEYLVKNLFVDVRKKYGKLDYLINNAGTASMNHSLTTPVATVKRILDTNVVGMFIISRESVKLMKKNNFGRIVNFSSFAVPYRLEGESIYAASKAAVVSLTQVLSREYAKYNITVNAVAPPAVKTDLIRGVPDDKMLKLISRQSLQKYGTPDSVRHVIDFYLSEQSDLITGEVIYMGGI